MTDHTTNAPLLTLIRIPSSFSAADPWQRWTISGHCRKQNQTHCVIWM